VLTLANEVAAIRDLVVLSFGLAKWFLSGECAVEASRPVCRAVAPFTGLLTDDARCSALR